MSDVLIKTEEVSKKFCRSLKRSLWYGVHDIASELNPFGRGARAHAAQLRQDEFWAVEGVSFEVRRGECLGLIGRNGAGKTTLLKMLNGLIKPDRGRIEIRGRVGALIALGAGFNPILTGRENIYVNGSVLGLSRAEIDSKLDEIVDFAEVGEFIDSPVQSYSSGMQVRLGFAVATALEPDVLLLDEVLAVGDAAFRAKCYDRIGKLQERAAVIFVSHQMEQVARISNRALVMSRGRPVCLGSPEEGVRIYEHENDTGDSGDNAFLTHADPVTSARITASADRIGWNESLSLTVDLHSTAPVEAPGFYGLFYERSGAPAASFVTEGDRALSIETGPNRLMLRIDKVPLASGTYTLGLSINRPGSITQLLWSYKQLSVQVHSGPPGFCAVRLPLQAKAEAAALNGRTGSAST